MTGGWVNGRLFRDSLEHTSLCALPRTMSLFCFHPVCAALTLRMPLAIRGRRFVGVFRHVTAIWDHSRSEGILSKGILRRLQFGGTAPADD